MRNPELSLTHPSATKGQLVALAGQVPGAWEGLKIAALLLALEGQRPSWIAEVLGLTRMSLNRWIHRVNAHGVESLKPAPRVGRPSRLTPALCRALERDLEKSPRELGLNRAQWDGPTLVTYLKRRFGINLKVRQAQYWMHQLGYRLKRAGYSYLQARVEEARQFQRRLKKTSQPGSA
jgi:transposase